MVGIFFGSSTGSTEALAKEIAPKFSVGATDIHNVANASAGDVQKYDLLLLGASTWGFGELQDDWFGFLAGLKKENLAGKKVALFGTGDHESYPDTFCDSLGIIKEELAGTGCIFVGAYDQAGYAGTDSKAFEDGKAIGLAADEDNEPEMTPERMERWIAAIEA